MPKQYDLIVIGGGPAGEKAAVKAAYFGYKVALIEKEDKVGGAGVHTGTIPSKTLKETALFLSGKSDHGLYGVDRQLIRPTSVSDFLFRKDQVRNWQAESMHHNLKNHNVDVYHGEARFEDANTVRVCGDKEIQLRGEYTIIATGSYPFHPSNIPFDGRRVHDSDSILSLERFPKSLCIVGAGVIGCEYATIFAAMGVKVYLVNSSDAILGFLDKEISTALVKQMSDNGVEILFNTSMASIHVPESDSELIRIPLKSEEILNVDMFLYAAGRSGSTKHLNCSEIGVKVGQREAIEVNANYQTSIANIYAVGDVIGFPALASTSMDQGRVAVANIFNLNDINHIAEVYPYGIYTIPEVSCVGINEEQAKAQGLDYCVGRAQYADMPRGKIMGAKDGFMKIIFTRDDEVIRGVHVIGNIASEIIHYGMALVENKKTLHDVIGSIFNYPTLHDLYKYCCYDGLGNMTGHKIIR